MQKTCSKCGETKAYSYFHKNSCSSDGLQSCCKACRSNYYIDNRSRYRERHLAWSALNKEKVRESNSMYYSENRTRILERHAAYRSENREAFRRYWANRRFREIGGKLSKGIIQKLLTMQRGKCACCGNPLGDDYHLDHIMPLALGGTNTDDNIQLLRAECNMQKNRKHPVDFMRQRGFLL